MNSHRDVSGDDFTEPVFDEVAPAAPADALRSVVSRRSYDAKLGRAAKDIQKRIAEHGKSLVEAHNKAHPTQQLRQTGAPVIATKGREGNAAVVRSLLIRILSTKGAAESQTAIRRYVETQHSGHAVYKDWTKPLPAFMRKTAQAIAYASGEPFSQIKLNAKTTLSSLHKEVRVAVARHNGQEVIYKASIAVTTESVSVNGVSFKITQTASGGGTYGTVRFPLKKLLQALEG